MYRSNVLNQFDHGEVVGIAIAIFILSKGIIPLYAGKAIIRLLVFIAVTVSDHFWNFSYWHVGDDRICNL